MDSKMTPTESSKPTGTNGHQWIKGDGVWFCLKCKFWMSPGQVKDRLGDLTTPSPDLLIEVGYDELTCEGCQIWRVMQT